jgi:hypothetical protein
MSDHDQFTEKLLEEVRNLEELLNLPTGFFLRLLEEGDDWSFMIKTLALIESGTKMRSGSWDFNPACSEGLARIARWTRQSLEQSSSKQPKETND